MSSSMPPPPVLLPNLPDGWSRGNVPSPVVRRAREVLKMPLSYGDVILDTIDGITYAFRREPHYDNHPSLRPGQSEDAPDAPDPFWHPGISVWTKVDPNAPNPLGGRWFSSASSSPKPSDFEVSSAQVSRAPIFMVFVAAAVAGYMLAPRYVKTL